ncbi:MAG: hypothetical protein DRJ01_09700 [Bacteroidetes bacterium]|nr:MAG: hypothetical protein DRJ01_09700 [Bacteroidota bacterium]
MKCELDNRRNKVALIKIKAKDLGFGACVIGGINITKIDRSKDTTEIIRIKGEDIDNTKVVLECADIKTFSSRIELKDNNKFLTVEVPANVLCKFELILMASRTFDGKSTSIYTV